MIYCNTTSLHIFKFSRITRHDIIRYLLFERSELEEKFVAEA